MRLIITRHGSGWGGAVGSAVVDLNTHKIHYINDLIRNNEGFETALTVYRETEGKCLEEELNKLGEYRESLGLKWGKGDCAIDIEELKEKLNSNLEKEEKRFCSFDAQEDYLALENNGNIHVIYIEDNSRKLRFKDEEVNKAIKILIQLVG